MNSGEYYRYKKSFSIRFNSPFYLLFHDKKGRPRMGELHTFESACRELDIPIDRFTNLQRSELRKDFRTKCSQIHTAALMSSLPFCRVEIEDDVSHGYSDKIEHLDSTVSYFANRAKQASIRNNHVRKVAFTNKMKANPELFDRESVMEID